MDQPPQGDPPAALMLPLPDTVRLASVRSWTAAALTGWTEDEREDCLLVMNELVSNAYDHGSGPRRLRLSCASPPGLVRIEVDDTSSEAPTPRRSRISTTRGRGLVIVQQLSQQWGVIFHDFHKTVWAQISTRAAHLAQSR
ncbi:ATP-binding protein [Actinosynnema sp. CS-041913]|uniref:ATP-binding protein n=1 Tax=Actinosynnema sp. CS-041913 TaxID=3239917 RepID=UPI003D8CF837